MANLGKYIAQIVIAGGQIVGRAFTRALREELRNSQQAAAAQGGSRAERSKAAAESLQMGMSLQESRQILNLSDPDNPQEILDKYNHLFDINDKDKGGSFYLQSKVYRAKERIDAELRNRGVDLKSFYSGASGAGDAAATSDSTSAAGEADKMQPHRATENDSNIRSDAGFADSSRPRRSRRNPS